MHRAARLVVWWAGRYTRGLPPEVGDRRRAEIESDVFEQTHAGDGRGTAVVWRALRGVHADLAWRRQELRLVHGSHRPPSRLRSTWRVVTQSWFAPLAVLIGVFDLLASIAVLTEADGTMPGQVIGPILMTTLALSVFGGLRLRWRAGEAIVAAGARDTGVATRVSARQVGWLAAVVVVSFGLLTVGVSTGAVPVLFVALALFGGTALVLGGRAIATAVRSADMADKLALATGMIIVGTLPAFALFWMVLPPVVAIAVIAGALGTNPRVRPAA